MRRQELPTAEDAEDAEEPRFELRVSHFEWPETATAEDAEEMWDRAIV